MKRTDLLIIGAGPYGLSIASYAKAKEVSFMIVGNSMSFWRDHMPRGMALRSPLSWHFDALGRFTFQRFVDETSRTVGSGNPVPLELFLDYARWYEDRSGLQVAQNYVTRLERTSNGFETFFSDREPIASRNVVVASGLREFRYIPPELAAYLHPAQYLHACDLCDLGTLKGKSCLIIGGRQSAFEWAALLREQADAEVHLVYRHDTPRFLRSDWSWVEPMVEATLREPGWFRRQPQADRQAIHKRFWEEGRSKLEPWLEPRIQTVHRWPHSSIAHCRDRGSGTEVTLNTGTRLHVDVVIFCTGYRMHVTRIPFLMVGSLLSKLAAHPCWMSPFKAPFRASFSPVILQYKTSARFLVSSGAPRLPLTSL